MCVCVYERERAREKKRMCERERKRKKDVCLLECVCVPKREGEREGGGLSKEYLYNIAQKGVLCFTPMLLKLQNL